LFQQHEVKRGKMGMFDFMKKRDPLDDLKLPDQDFGSSDLFGHSKQDLQSPRFSDQSFGQNLSQDFSQQPSSAFSQPSQPTFQNSSLSYPQGYPMQQIPAVSSRSSHEMEILFSKLDVIKSLLENVSQRVAMLEQKVDIDNERRKRSW
jgi:hypothetical protein